MAFVPTLVYRLTQSNLSGLQADTERKMKQSRQNFEAALRHEFEVFAAKRPVNRPTAQTRASRAYQNVKHLFTGEERVALSIAWNHATFVGEGRSEHDSVCQKIRERIWGVKPKVRRKPRTSVKRV
jgi:hypothetical protein